jgi:hypothetical protein
LSTATIPTNANPPPPEKFPAFEDSDIRVIEGRTLSKGNGWWSAILLVETYHKIQVKLYLWQEKEDKTTGQKTWKRKQHYTVNSFNWTESVKIVNEFLAKRGDLVKSGKALPSETLIAGSSS